MSGKGNKKRLDGKGRAPGQFRKASTEHRRQERQAQRGAFDGQPGQLASDVYRR